MDAAHQYHRQGMRLTLVGLLINGCLGTVKLVTGLLGHSYALVADAIESFGDLFGSLVVWSGLRIAAQPADEDHPYGHGKAEALAALIVAFMLVAAAFGIGVQAIREILTPHHAPAAYTLWVLLAVVVVKETLFRVMHRVADQQAGGAVLADAWHHRSDAITSAAAAIGISIALWAGPGYERADDCAAILASGIILYNAVRLMRPPLHELMDAEPTEIVARVRSVAERVPGVAGVDKVFARKSGLRYWVDLHVEVDPDMSVRAAHGLAHSVKDTIRLEMPHIEEVLIHVEPAPDSCG